MAQAPAFPAKTITLVCPLGAGSSIDVIARIYATKASALLGVPVIVDNKPGAGSAIAAGLVMRAAPDGHTLLIASNTYIVAPHVYRKSEYDPLVTFTPVTGLFTTGIVMSARPDFPECRHSPSPTRVTKPPPEGRAGKRRPRQVACG